MQTIGDAVQFSLLGMGIVFVVLALLVAVLGVLKRLDGRWQAAERAEAETPAPRDAQTIDDTTLVLISAAVATVVGGRGRIRSIRRVLPSDAPSSVWSAQGRATLQGSHVIQRGGRR